MGYWGKIIGAAAGFAVGGPFGAFAGMVAGHAADAGMLRGLHRHAADALSRTAVLLGPARLAALLGRREEVFAISVVVLAAKLAKCDGPVTRAEIDAFRQHFRVPPQSLHHVGQLFDQARETAAGFELFADQLGQTFGDNRGTLEEVLAALFAIARADGPLNATEERYLWRVRQAFGLDEGAWSRAERGALHPGADLADPYTVLGLSPDASDSLVHETWRRLMRENHPDTLAAHGVPEAFIAKATEKVARINAAWDRIKRERGL